MERVLQVVARDDFQLVIRFDTGEWRMFDARPYLDKGVFKTLRDPVAFKRAFVKQGTVCWPDELDIAPETLYDRSVVCEAVVGHDDALPEGGTGGG